MVIVNPSSHCFCGKEVGAERLALLESGQMKPMEKDNRFLRFYPDWKLPTEAQPLKVHKIAMHEECIVEAAEAAGIDVNHDAPDWKCQNCDHSFKSDRWAFRLTFGSAGEDCVLLPEIKVILCSYCTAALFGEGNEEEGDAFLNGDEDEE